MKLDPERAALVVIDVQEAFRKALPSFDEVAAATATLVAGRRRRSGSRSWSPSSTRRGWGRPSPEVAEHLPERHRAAREGPLLRRRGRRLRPRRARPGARLRDRDPRLRQPDRARPARRRTSRSTSPPTRSARAPRPTASSAWRRWSAPARSLTSVETALFELLGGSDAAAFKRSAGARQVSDATGYVLLEDGTRFDGELCGAAGEAHRRGRLQHRDDRLPGGGHRPHLRRPDHHLHLPADRQLRRRRRGDGVRPGPGARA